MKCANCGYTKNDMSAEMCALCGEILRVVQEPPTEARVFGGSKDLRKAKAEVKQAGKPNDEHIVYAGDFAIVYAFVPISGEMLLLKPAEVFTFGRGDAADFKIDAKTVSRRHARVHWQGTDPPVPEIVDLESKNGVRVNGTPVKRKILEDGDEVVIGPFVAALRVFSANDDLQAQMEQVDRLGATMVMGNRLEGEVSLCPLAGLLRHLEDLKESGTISVQSSDSHGYLTMISGVAIAAGFDAKEGPEAIKSIARLKTGKFTFSPRAEVTAPQSMGRSLLEILDEVAPLPSSGPAPRPGPGPGGPGPGMPQPGRRRRPPPRPLGRGRPRGMRRGRPRPR
jgi:pSer/pThr/pTyr-binding forkhead associated (FHA) protein